MAVSLKNGFCVSGVNEIGLNTNKQVNGSSTSMGSLRFTELKTTIGGVSILKKEFEGTQVVMSNQKGFDDWKLQASGNFSVRTQTSVCVSRARRWWEKTLQPNMLEINSAQELVDTLRNAGDELVIIDFYSPGCGGCKALHPKICQLAEQNPNSLFLKVNHEEHKAMCYSLNVHVLPFFRFYRGAEGRVGSFSCTNATIKKFKDALAKHGTDRCCLGPAKGLEETEILKLASNKEINFDYSPSRSLRRETMEELVYSKMGSDDLFSIKTEKKIEVGVGEENATLVM